MPFNHNDLFVELILLILFAFNVVIQLFYYWYFFARLAFRKIPEPPVQSLPVSVVISAKNEYSNLKKHLPLIIDQDYPDFEVLVVDDASTDESDELLDEMEKQYERLKVIHIRQDLNFFKGKKFPLSIGIKSAKNDLILLTDADCRPTGRNWIRSMAARFHSQTEVV
ncbi:MAG: glycosyltransferase, partial [Bacteroidales bacterium]|nr:glycosyltransferase [Bacteroidales bacterium]